MSDCTLPILWSYTTQWGCLIWNWVMVHVLHSAVLKLAILEQIHNKVMEVRLSLFLMVNILTLSIVLSFFKHVSKSVFVSIIRCKEGKVTTHLGPLEGIIPNGYSSLCLVTEKRYSFRGVFQTSFKMVDIV